MASDPQGSTRNLSDSRAEALQALVNSLDPGSASSSAADTLSKDHVAQLSEKLKGLLGVEDLLQGAGVRGNEQQDEPPLNEEGLPIIEISEPMDSVSKPAMAGAAPTVNAEDDASFVPMYRLPPTERAHNKAQMDRILDMLEEEERIEEERNDARDRQHRREELEQLRANAKAEVERARALKDMQKKMGKALLQNMADARAKDEQATAQQMREDLELEEARRSRKPRKSVSWAELPKSEKLSTLNDDDDTRSRLPLRPDVVERFPTRPISSPSPPPRNNADSDDEDDDPPLSDDTGDGDEDEPEEGGHASSSEEEDEFDIDTMQHQREIALAYFEKRNKIGVDASAHSHEWGSEDQQDVSLDTTLTGGRPPKSPHSKFKSERFAAPPPSTSTRPRSANVLLHAVRTGKLEDDQLVGGGSSSDEGEGYDNAFMEALRRGDVTNAGAVSNSDALIAALESAYSAPPPPPSVAAPPRTLDEGPREGAAASAMRETVFERKRPAVAIIDSPSFPPASNAPPFPTSSSSRRPTRPPTVLPASSLARESQQQQQQANAPVPGKKMSRFKAQQTGS